MLKYENNILKLRKQNFSEIDICIMCGMPISTKVFAPVINNLCTGNLTIVNEKLYITIFLSTLYIIANFFEKMLSIQHFLKILNLSFLKIIYDHTILLYTGSE